MHETHQWIIISTDALIIALLPSLFQCNLTGMVDYIAARSSE